MKSSLLFFFFGPSAFLPKRTILVAHRGMLGLRAWGDGLIVVLFEFLDDDTKLAQSCRNWLCVRLPLGTSTRALLLGSPRLSSCQR